jgi:hypothetical protein
MPIIDVGFTGLANVANAPDTLLKVGPTVWVQVAPGPRIAADFPISVMDAALNPSARPQTADAAALLDTGASDSCIDQELADQLTLPLVDRWRAAGVGGSHEMNVYLATITIPPLGLSKSGLFMAAHLQAGGQVHKVLLGRDSLTDLIIIYDGRKGSVSLCR